MKGAAKLLIKPLTEELVLTALEKLKRGSSPGPDGLPAEALMAFPSILVPKMTEMIQQFLAQGKISEKWATAILAPIPKEKGRNHLSYRFKTVMSAECFIQMGLNGPVPHVARFNVACRTTRAKRIYEKPIYHLDERLLDQAQARASYTPLFWGHSRSIPQGMIFDVQPLVKSLFCPIRPSPNGFFDFEASIP